MPVPPTGPATLARVKGWLAVTGDAQDDAIQDTIDAVNVVVRRLPTVVDGVDSEDTWPADIEAGAVMLAGRVYRRRNSPDGVAAFTDQGAVYISRNDPDIGMLLQLGGWSMPGVG